MTTNRPRRIQLRWLVTGLFLCGSGCATFTPSAQRDPAELLSDTPTRSEMQSADKSAPDGTPEKKALSIDDFSPDNITKTTKSLTGYGPNREEALKLFAEGEEAYRRGLTETGNARTNSFVDAQAKFAKAASRYPDSALEQDALFYAGECAFFTDQYPKANEFFEKLIKAYPNNRHMDVVDQRRFLIARWWIDQTDKSPESFWAVNMFDNARPWRDTRGMALRVFDKIRLDDPTGRLADDATLASGNAQFAKGDYLRAEDFYEDLRNNFPTSEHQFTAHFLGLKSTLLSYRGSNYSGTALDKADKLVKQIKRSFPDDYQREKEFIDRTAAEIRFRQAEREWDRGAYYDFRGEYRAAISHYQLIAKKFSDTPFGERAQKRIGEISGLPPVPEQKAQWLVDLLPEPDPIKPMVEAALRKDAGTVQR